MSYAIPMPTCERCGAIYAGSHYHCGACDSLDVTGMYGHHTAWCKRTGKHEEFHHCGPNGACDLALDRGSRTERSIPMQNEHYLSRMNISEDTQRLATRLRMLAEELESAGRYGVPIPESFGVSGYEHGGATAAMTEAEFDAWVEYTEATRIDYEYQGDQWSRAEVDVNGLPMRFCLKHEADRA